MKVIPLTTTPQLVWAVTGPLTMQAEGGDVRVSFDGSADASLTPRQGTRLRPGQPVDCVATGPLWAVAVEGSGATLCVQAGGELNLCAGPACPLSAAAPLVPVFPAVGSVGLIALPTFANGNAPLASPTIGSPYHGARAITLTALAGNAGIVYWSQFNTVRPVGGTANIQYINQPSFDAQGNWNNDTGNDAEWTISGGTADFTINNGGGSVTSQLYQAITAPAGAYSLVVEVDAFTTTGGNGVYDVFLDVAVEGIVISTIRNPGTYTYPVTVGANPTVSFIGSYSGTVASGQITLASVTLSIAISAANVGIPLAAGASIILSGRDIDLDRPIYVVPVIANAAEKVIANYLY